MKKIKFNPQELISIIIGAVSSGYLVSQGVSVEQATLIGNSLGGISMGLSFDNKNPSKSISDILSKSVRVALDSNTFEMSDNCKNLLQNELAYSQNIVDYLCAQDPEGTLRTQIVRICNQSPDCDINTFPVNNVVSSIISQYENSVRQNQDLTIYAIYRILRNNMISHEVYTANQQYVNSFTETLFLHRSKSSANVNLTNLFILPKYCELKNKESVDSSFKKNDLQNRLKSFINNDDYSVLFIEGDGGIGKTTLIAWLNYHYSLADDVALDILDNRPLVTIRLRDLDKNDVTSEGGLPYAIRRYMYISSFDEIEATFPNAVMVLDGFDELCMIDGVYDHEQLLHDLFRSHLDGFKFIITTRPKYINPQIDIPSVFIFLLHFDSEQRRSWIEHYTSLEYCGEPMDEKIRQYIESIDDDLDSCICDTPMTLYMLAAKRIKTDILKNTWALYHHIFYTELSETEYNKMFPDENRRYSHDINRLRDSLYQISEEIAYRMYQNGNRMFYLSDQDLREIIENLSKRNVVLRQANIQLILERCYALCCYWKANVERGAVEFLHNNIRDFFLAEKIYREMDSLYASTNNTNEISQIISKLCDLFQFGVLDTTVTEFIFYRAEYNRENSIGDFAQREYDNLNITCIMSEMLSNGTIFNATLIDSNGNNPIRTIMNILTCTAQVYRHAYEPYLSEDETIPWVDSANRLDMLRYVFKSMFCQIPITFSHREMITMGSHGQFCYLDMKSCDLRNIGFQWSVVKNTNFSDAILCGCDFSNADLSFSDFSNADLHYSCLRYSNMCNCVLIGADLRGTELPDGYCSIDQNEQVEHLKLLNIPGLKI